MYEVLVLKLGDRVGEVRFDSRKDALEYLSYRKKSFDWYPRAWKTSEYTTIFGFFFWNIEKGDELIFGEIILVKDGAIVVQDN